MRGEIYNRQKYLRGKLLDHSGWGKLLPRRITPSDIDMVFDNNGKILMVELNSKVATWGDLPMGQRILYQNLVKAGGGKIMAACARHADVEQIDTTKDILDFQLMYWMDNKLGTTSVFGQKYWPLYVRHFFGEKI